MNNPVDQPKVSELIERLRNAAEIVPGYVNHVYGSTFAALFAEAADALAALPQPQATTVGVTEAMVDAALNASWGEDGRPIWSFINDEHPHALMTTALKAALIGIPGAEKLAGKSFTLNLTDVEIEALEALAKKQELSPQRVLIQGLRHYQLLVNGEPDLGPMLPPVEAPRAEKGEAVAWEDVPADIQELAKTIAPGAPRYHFAICCAIIEARRAAPTSERVQALEQLDYVNGEMWVAGRKVFEAEAEAYRIAQSTALAMALADRAPEKIYLAMVRALNHKSS